jgi:tetratricopeptide (TPR) repeat protein
MSTFDFYGESALLSRLTRAIELRHQQVIFLVGSPLSAPVAPSSIGVPNVDGIIAMIRGEFAGDTAELADYEREIAQSCDRRYQDAFRFLQGNRGQPVANEVIRRAVLRSRTTKNDKENLSDAGCRLLESDLEGWTISPSTAALGRLVTNYPTVFGHALLTTNYDPLLEIAIRRAGGQLFRTTLHADGDLHQTEGDGCHVIHLHGFWYNSDTLNTTRQLTQERPRLKASLTNLLKDRLVVVCGYGGWDDVFTSTLLDLVRDDSAGPEVLWTFFQKNPVIPSALEDQLTPGIARGRVLLYSGIDCNSVLPKLGDSWAAQVEPVTPSPQARSNPVQISVALQESIAAGEERNPILEGDDEDRPPLVDFCVGREDELRTIDSTDARVLFVTGIGGQGKSTVAAKYYADALSRKKFTYFLWRDCKEEAERFENQIASVIETLTGGVLSGSFLAKQNIEMLVEMLSVRLKDVAVLFVFDNVDHYVNLETNHLTSGADLFIKSVLSSSTESKVIFTCRPDIRYELNGTLSIKLEGISQQATTELFAKRKADSTSTEISRAHILTNGHAFWLDLLALQVASRTPKSSLGNLLDEAEGGGGELPAITLQSIWNGLKENERSILRCMAETVRPETEAELGEYLRSEMNYNKLTKGLRSLRTQNLIVRKQAANGDNLLELHPIVRHFVRNSFSRDERASAINAIITVYRKVMSRYRELLSVGPTFTILQNWTQAAELEIEADRIQDAILVLADSSDAFASSAFTREYSRAVRLLLASFDWIRDWKKYQFFDKVFRMHIRILSYLGEYAEADEQLVHFAQSVPERDANYIFYCELRCYSEWLRGNYTSAVEWGRRGQSLIDESGADVNSDIALNLALAERDAGKPEIALPIFLGGNTLSAVLDPEELDEKREGAYYGNIGRCLQFMGRVDQALICYQKSALLVEQRPGNEHTVNQGFIRFWIGELLLARKQERLGMIFFEAARRKWESVSPPKMKVIEELQEQLGVAAVKSARSEPNVERICKEWILGKYLDTPAI